MANMPAAPKLKPRKSAPPSSGLSADPVQRKASELLMVVNVTSVRAIEHKPRSAAARMLCRTPVLTSFGLQR